LKRRWQHRSEIISASPSALSFVVIRSRPSTAFAVPSVIVGLACALVLIAVAMHLQRAVPAGHAYESPRAAAGLCGQPPAGTPGTDASWHAPQPVNVLTATAGWQCPDTDASCGSFIVRGPHAAIDTHSRPAPPARHREIHHRSLPLLI
jgi:hypothetical protein